MATTQSLYQLKQQTLTKKNQNTLTDSDYFLRDKEEEGTRGYPNSIDMTPPLPATKAVVEPKAKKVVAKGE